MVGHLTLRQRVACVLTLVSITLTSGSATLAMQTSPTATIVPGEYDPYIGIWVSVDNSGDTVEVSHSTYDAGYTFTRHAALDFSEMYPAYKNSDGTLTAPSARAAPPRDISYDKQTGTLLIVTHSQQPPLAAVYRRQGAAASPGSEVSTPGMPATGASGGSAAIVAATTALLLACVGAVLVSGKRLGAARKAG